MIYHRTVDEIRYKQIAAARRLEAFQPVFALYMQACCERLKELHAEQAKALESE